MLIMPVLIKAGPLCSAFYRHYFKMKNNYEKSNYKIRRCGGNSGDNSSRCAVNISF